MTETQQATGREAAVVNVRVPELNRLGVGAMVLGVGLGAGGVVVSAASTNGAAHESPVILPCAASIVSGAMLFACGAMLVAVYAVLTMLAARWWPASVAGAAQRA